MLGVGLERGAPVAEVARLAAATLAESGFGPQAVACVVSLDIRSDEAAILELARSLGVPTRFFNAATLALQEPHVSQVSEHVRKAVGTPSVAEAAALAAAGPGAKLVVTKRKSAHATCAIARKPA
jgi:cobalt-precorrin 5A hydrolase/precorrin-3B C17-methyltransferase